MSDSTRYYIADVRGVAVVVTERPDKPAAVPFRCREKAQMVAEKINADRGVSFDGDEVTK